MMVFKLSFITHTQIHPLTDFVILQIEVAVFHEHCVCGCVWGGRCSLILVKTVWGRESQILCRNIKPSEKQTQLNKTLLRFGQEVVSVKDVPEWDSLPIVPPCVVSFHIGSGLACDLF